MPHENVAEPSTAVPAPASPSPSAEESRPRGLRDRITLLAFRVTERLKLGVSAAYLAAGSLIGFEFLVGIMSFSSLWPVSIPFVIGTLALVYYVRKRIRRMRRRSGE